MDTPGRFLELSLTNQAYREASISNLFTMELLDMFLLTAVLFTMITFILLTSQRVRKFIRILRRFL